MLMSLQVYIDSIVDLHKHIIHTHWDGEKLVGPDPVGKIHWRITRFARSYLPFLPYDDCYIYLQGQAYWIRSNLQLFNLTKDNRYLDIMRHCANYIVRTQPADGAWRHPPILGRKGFISTVEGVWASLGLMAAFRETADESYLKAAVCWYDFQVNELGFQDVTSGGLAANYYAHSTHKVPNVTTMLMWLTAELATQTGDNRFLTYTNRMRQFIFASQMENGELPYVLDKQPHFMCFQYNSFQFLDLANYYDLTNDGEILPVLEKLAQFLVAGVTLDGHCKYNCFAVYPEVNYWTGAIAAALYKATLLGLGEYTVFSERAYHHLLLKQEEDGRFCFSKRNYKFLRDKRSYPRYLSMILNHLLFRVETDAGVSSLPLSIPFLADKQ